MAVDVGALKAAPAGDKRGEALIAECRSRLGGEWKLLASSVKMRKSIFEAEYNGRRVIGKVSGSKKAQTAFGSLTKLRDAGMRPPHEFTVPEPIAWIEDRKLLVLEKAPGESLLDVLKESTGACGDASRAAELLLFLHSLTVPAPRDPFNVAAAQQRATELTSAVDDPRIAPAAEEAIAILGSEPARVVLSHGDYHPMNVYVAPGRVTAIDLDTVALREQEADVGYFLAQAANFGLLISDSLKCTREMRETFVAKFPALDKGRLSAHIAWALLQSLHYDACILKVKNDKAGLMAQAARSVLSTGNLDAAEA